MKVRTGFVSNSSSSSFICDVCGEEAIGRDISLQDAEMFECENNHYVCNSHRLEVDKEKLREWAIKTLDKKLEDYKNPEEYKWLKKERREEIIISIKKIKEELKTLEIFDEDLKWLSSKSALDTLFYSENIKENIENIKEESENSEYGVSKLCCPICSYKEINKKDAYDALIKYFNLSPMDVIDILKEMEIYK